MFQADSTSGSNFHDSISHIAYKKLIKIKSFLNHIQLKPAILIDKDAPVPTKGLMNNNSWFFFMVVSQTSTFQAHFGDPLQATQKERVVETLKIK